MKKKFYSGSYPCMFFGHKKQISSFALLAEKLLEGGVESICLVIGKHDYQEAIETRSFSLVLDLLPSENVILDPKKYECSIEYLNTLNDSEYSVGLNYDIACDRYFRGMSSQDILQSELSSKWSLNMVYNFLSEVGRKIEIILSEYSPKLIYLESNNSVYRLAKRIARTYEIPSGYLMIAKGWDNRVYFEQGLVLNWEECRLKYSEILSVGLAKEVRNICAIKIRDITSSAGRPDTYMSFKHGPSSLFDRLKTFLHLIDLRKMNDESWKINPRAVPLEYTTFISKIRRYKREKRAFKYLQQISVRFEDLPDVFVTYFLHVQPEITVEESAFIYSDQVATIRNIAAILPVGVGIVVKEHRPVAGKRNLEFYSELFHVPNVYVMGEEIHSHKLIQSSSGVITLTGTVGLESLVYGKNVIVLGEIFLIHSRGYYIPKGGMNFVTF